MTEKCPEVRDRLLNHLEVLPEAEGGVRGQGYLPLAGVVEDSLVGRDDLEAAAVDVQHRT